MWHENWLAAGIYASEMEYDETTAAHAMQAVCVRRMGCAVCTFSLCSHCGQWQWNAAHGHVDEGSSCILDSSHSVTAAHQHQKLNTKHPQFESYTTLHTCRRQTPGTHDLHHSLYTLNAYLHALHGGEDGRQALVGGCTEPHFQ